MENEATRYDYGAAVREALYEWIENADWYFGDDGKLYDDAQRPCDEEDLVDAVWGDDSVTGNGPLGYWPGPWPENVTVEAAVASNLRKFFYIIREWGISVDELEARARDGFRDFCVWADIMLRLDALYGAAYEICSAAWRNREEE